MSAEKTSNYYKKYLAAQSSSLKNLSKKQLLALEQLLEEGINERDNRLKPIQVRDIVPIEQWVNDSYYIGSTGVSLYDYWKEELIDIFREKDNPQYNEIIIEGGLGCVALDTVYETSLGELTLNQLIEKKKNGLLHDAKIKSDDPAEKCKVAILDVNSVGIKKTKKVTFSNGVYVEGTCDHRIKILSKDGEVCWCRFDELNENTQVLYCSKNIPPKIENIPLEKAKNKWHNYLYLNDCSLIYPVEIEDGECECGDVTVEGAVYVRDGLINHNTGKSTFATHVVQRFFYELSCWKNIPALFGLKGTTSISGMYFSLTKAQAEISGFRDIRNLIDDTPYFRENFPRNDRLDSRLDFPENVFIYYGSNVTHQISLNLVISIVDEANFFKDPKNRTSKDKMVGGKVAELHSSLLNRQASRFSQKGGNKSLSILISSPTFYSSYTQTRIALARDNPHAKVIKPRKWDTTPELYSGKKFYVFLGNEKLDPKIIENKEDLNIVCASMEAPPVIFDDVEDAIEECPDYVKEVIGDVPVELYENYRTNLIKCIGDFSAHSVQTQGKLFSSRKLFFASVDSKLPNLFWKTNFTISTTKRGASNSIDYYLRMPFAQQDRKRFIHIDQSTSGDCTGIACCYLESAVSEEGTLEPQVVLDFALRITPPTDGGQIDIERVRSFVLYMQNKLKLNIGKVTYDQFQSSESIQQLKKAGLNAGKQSVESDVPYLAFLNLFYKNRIRMPEQTAELIASEIFDLEHLREIKRVDHVEGKSKDVCDAVVGCVWAALNSDLDIDKPRHTIEEARAVIMANSKGLSKQKPLFSASSFLKKK